MADNTVIHHVEFTGDASKLQDACTKASQAVSNLGNSLNSDSKKIDSASNSLSNMGTRVSSIFSGLGATISVASFGLFIKSALQTSAQLEQTAISFEVFTGSALVAKNTLSDLKDQALNSPMQFQDIAKGAQTLLGYGLTAQQVIPITKMLGDISGGNADRFNRLALAFGQVNASGRLMGQEARQMINAGFNPLQAISEKTGESMASLSKRMHDGQISVKEVGDAFTYATSEGGRFFGLADRQSQTLQGQFNKLSESITFAMAEIGSSISSNLQLGDVITHIGGVIDQLKESFIGANYETRNASVWNGILKTVIDSLGITIDLAIKLWNKLTLDLGRLLQMGEPIVTFFDQLDTAILNWADSIKTEFPNVASAISGVLNYVNNFGKSTSIPSTISESITDLEGKIERLQQRKVFLQFGSFGYKDVETQIENYKKEIEILKNNSGKGNGLSGLNNKPPGLANQISPEEAEALRQFKRDQEEMKRAHEKALDENYRRQQKLIEIEKDTIFKLGSLNLSAEEKALADLKNEFENKKKIYEEGNRSIVNLETLYNEQRDKIQKEYASKRRRQAIDDLQAETEGLKSEYPKRLSDFYNDFLNTDIQGKIGNYAQSVYSAIKDLNVNLATGVAELAGTALATGMSMADTFKAFGAIILNALGDVLIKIGTSAIAAGMVGTALKAFFSGGISTVPELGIAGGIAAVTVGSAMKALSGNIKNAQSNLNNKSTGMTTPTATRTSNMSSGSSYQYGGSSYSTQSMRLSIDLTGSITATQTGYQINKSLETVLRVTGR